MTRNEFVAAMRKNPAWTEDRWGHFRSVKITRNGEPVRLKVGTLAVRLEVRLADRSWCNIRSDYYKAVRISDDGKVWIKDKGL